MKRDGKPGWIYLAVMLAMILGVGAALAFDGTEDDDFEDGTTMNWQEGPPSPNPPVNVADGGPGGAGDNYLENFSSGEFGAGGRMAMFNPVQWAGDYNAVGSAIVIEADMANFGPNALSMRLAVQSLAGTWYSSTVAQPLAADSQWHPVVFELIDADMTLVSGTETLSQVLDDVFELRILSSAAPNFAGDRLEATLGVDNFRVVSVPVELQSFTIE